MRGDGAPVMMPQQMKGAISRRAAPEESGPP
jgi:hypothetical protein